MNISDRELLELAKAGHGCFSDNWEELSDRRAGQWLSAAKAILAKREEQLERQRQMQSAQAMAAEGYPIPLQEDVAPDAIVDAFEEGDLEPSQVCPDTGEDEAVARVVRRYRGHPMGGEDLFREIKALIAQAVAQEREACAALAENLCISGGSQRLIAGQIRKRGQ